VRLGLNFYQSPVKLIEALLKRHGDITAERNNEVMTYHCQSVGKAFQMTDGSEKRALQTLTSWGMELFQSSIEDSSTLDMKLQPDGKIAFVKTSNPEYVLNSLNPNAIECSCRFWVAYGLSCSHLLLLYKGFNKSLCSRRWLKSSALESSAGNAPDDSIVAGRADDNGDLGAVSNDFQNDPKDGPAGGIADLDAVSNDDSNLPDDSGRKMSPGDIHRLTRELGHLVVGEKDERKRNQLLGAIVNIVEIAKGNGQFFQGISLEGIFHDHMSSFSQISTGQQRNEH
jgi:hypothetical protein